MGLEKACVILANLMLKLAPKIILSFHSAMLLLCFCRFALFMNHGKQELMLAGRCQAYGCVHLGYQTQQHL